MKKCSVLFFPSNAIIATAILVLCGMARCFGQGQSVAISTTGAPIGAIPGLLYSGTSFESVNLFDGTLNIHIPLLDLKGRGIDTEPTYYATSALWSWESTDGETYSYLLNNIYPYIGGEVAFPKMGTMWWTPSGCDSYDEFGNCMMYTYSILYNGYDGTSIQLGSKLPGQQGTMGVTLDYPSSYNNFLTSGDGSYLVYDFAATKNHFPDGTMVEAALWQTGDSSHPYFGGAVTDRNGNTIQCRWNQSYTAETCTDTVGRQIALSNVWGSGSGAVSYRDSNGNAQNVTITRTTMTVEYPYPDAWGQYDGCTCALVTSITLANGQQYQFQYDTNPNGSTTGEISKIILPTGGYIRYVYSYSNMWGGVVVPITDRYVSSDGTPATEAHYHYSYGGPPISECASWDQPYSGTNTVTYPDNSTEAVTWSSGLGGGTQNPTSITISSSTGSVLRSLQQYTTTTLSRNQTEGPFDYLGCNNPQLSSETTTLDDGTTISKTSSYDYYSNPTQVSVTGSDGASRTTSTTYLADANPAFSSPTVNLLQLPSLVTVTGSGGNESSVAYYYDASTPSSESNAVGHDDIDYPPSYATRGNVTSTVQGGLNATATTYEAYDYLGNVVSSTDANGNQTLTGYADSWSDATCAPGGAGSSVASGTTYAFPTQVTNPLSQITKYKYYSCSGLWGQVRDPNSALTSQTYDAINAPLVTTYPDGGSTSVSYNGYGTPLTVTTSKLATPDPTIVSSIQYDGLGRKQVVTASDDSTSETYYDSSGRVAFVTNPHFSYPSITDGRTSYQYDALDRLVWQENPDSSDQSRSYLGDSVTYTDENENQWTRTSDTLGRLVTVLEPNGSSQSPSMETDYTYDALDDLQSVTQWGGARGSSGARTRSFTYDDLSRLTAATNPESGTISYAYDANGNLTQKVAPAPNSTTAGATVTLGYSYDALNRLCYKFYSTPVPNCPSTTPSGAVAAYGYGTSATGYTIGRLVSEAVLNNGTVTSKNFGYTYDPTGRMASEQQCPLGNCSNPYTFQYAYDLAGSPISANNGLSGLSGINFGYGYDSAGQLCLVTNPGVPGSCALSGSGTSLFGAASYGPVGLLGAQLGATSSSPAAVTMTRAYDNRLRLVSESDTGLTQSAPASQSTGSITITGSEESTPGGAPGTATVTLSGSEQTGYYDWCWQFYLQNGYPYDGYTYNCPSNTLSYDYGQVYVVVNGVYAVATYGNSNESSWSGTAANVASLLASAINSTSGMPVTAAAPGNVLTLTAKTSGSNTDYSLSVGSYTLDSNGIFTSPSFYASPSGSALTGGNSGSPSYDSGTVTATINGVTTAPISWGQGSTASSLTSALSSQINTADSTFLSASASGSTINLHSTQTGSSTNWPVTITVTHTSSSFSTASFTVSAAGMSGGAFAASGNGVVYSYNLSGGFAPNGNLLSYTDTVMGTWNFNYDTLNRVATGNSNQPGNPYPNHCWSYDTFGNRTDEMSANVAFPQGQGGPNGCSTSGGLGQNEWAQYNGTSNGTANNQMSATYLNPNEGTNGYDVAGDVIYDGVNSYHYDPEGRLCAVQSGGSGGPVTGYLYNADGIRVAKGSMSSWACPTSQASFTAVTGQYLLGLSGEQVTELNGSGAPQHTNAWASGNLWATYDASGVLHFPLTDWLGSRRVEVNGSTAGRQGQIEQSCTSLPFGDQESCPPTPTEHLFTGKERDSESGNDYFGARYYTSSMGRFMSPDFNDDDDDPDPVPSADLENPQTLNLYSYTANNPLSRIDLYGHKVCGNAEEMNCDENGEAFQEAQDNQQLAQQLQQQQQPQKQQPLPHPVTTITVNSGDGGCNPSSNALCGIVMNSFFNKMSLIMPIMTRGLLIYSKAHGQGQRNEAGKASGTPNEEKVNKKARYDPKTKKWWVKDSNGKRKDLGPGFQPTPDQLKKAGLAAAGAAAGGITIWMILETAGGVALAF